MKLTTPRFTAVMLAAIGVLAVLSTMYGPASVARAHGYTENPMSRQGWCRGGQVSGCGPVQYEPQSVEGPKGFPTSGPEDGQICSAGNQRFAQLDDPSLNWPVSQVQAGQEVVASWVITASHRTTHWQYFITRDGWNPARPLTRAALEREPFATVHSDGASYPPNPARHAITLPEDKHGRHLILGVWSIADTGNAFYSCADVYLGAPSSRG